MTYDEIKRRVSAWLVQTNYTTAETLAIEQAYRDVFGRGVRDCKCPNRYRDAVIELRIFIKNHATMEKSTYKLKAGVVIQPSGTSEVYTNDNLTDEIAEQFLKERPGARGLFAVAPEPGDAVKGPENGKEAATTADNESLRAEVESLKVELAKMTTDRDEHAVEVARLNDVIADLKAELAKMTEYRNRAVADLDKIIKVAEDGGFKIDLSGEAAKVTTAKPAEQEPASEGGKEQDNAAPEAEKPSGLNPEILSAIKARLAGGDPKSAIIKDYVGMVVDGKSLTEYAVKKYITAASAE